MAIEELNIRIQELPNEIRSSQQISLRNTHNSSHLFLHLWRLLCTLTLLIVKYGPCLHHVPSEGQLLKFEVRT